MTSVSVDEVLNCSLIGNAQQDSNASTVRGYLKALLYTLWEEDEGFSVKRPFGNSSWKYDVFISLIHAGLMSGELDEDGYLEECDDAEGDILILKAIDGLQ